MAHQQAIDDEKMQSVSQIESTGMHMGKDQLQDAADASAAEHRETSWQTIKANKKAIFWSALISMSIVMEGYDTILIGNFFGYPAFQRKYGKDYGGTAGYQLSSPWQVGVQNASSVGTIFGIFFNGWVAAKFGYRKVMIYSLFLMNAFIFILFFAQNVQTLLVGEIFCGLAWGVFATIGPAYASEVCPLALRGYMTTYVNLCWAIGQFIAAGVLDGLVNRTDQWGYRIPFAVQWAWPIPLMIVCIFAPESPWYLCRTDQMEEARSTLHRLSNKTADEVKGTLAMMLHTIKIENEAQVGSSYIDCFRGTDLRRTEIVCLTFVGQILSGSTFAYGPTYFFEQAGMAPTEAYKMNVGGTAIAFCGTVLSWFLLARLGRRTLYLAGIITCFTVLMIIGIVSVSTSNQAGLWTQAGFTVFWLFVYSLTIGPIAYCIVSETSSIRLRAKSVCLARNSYNIINIVSGVLEPYFMNPTAWNLHGKTAFFWAGTAALTTIWAYFRLPEARGRTYEELDLMFARGVSARQFSKYQVDAYARETAAPTDSEGRTQEK